MENSLQHFASEDQFQAYCAQWFWNNPYLLEHRRMLFHVQQKSKNSIEGAKHKAMGKVRGPSDFVLVCMNKTVFIELKLPGKKQLPEQIDFMNKVRLRGHEYYVIETFSQFKAVVLRLLDIKSR